MTNWNNLNIGDKVHVLGCNAHHFGLQTTEDWLYDRLIVKHKHLHGGKRRTLIAVFESGSGFLEAPPEAFTGGWIGDEGGAV